MSERIALARTVTDEADILTAEEKVYGTEGVAV